MKPVCLKNACPGLNLIPQHRGVPLPPIDLARHDSKGQIIPISPPEESYCCVPSVPCMSVPLVGGTPLLSQSELDPWIAKSLADSSSEFVLSGYRPRLTFNGCTSSIFVLHNETINIWTHLVGAIVWVFMLQGTMQVLKHRGSDSVTLALTRTTYCMCIVMPLASAAYHTYKCLDDYICRMLLSIDIAGIHLLMFSRAMMEGYLVFFCTPTRWLNFTMIASVLGIALGAYGSYQRQQWPFIPAVLMAHIPIFWFLCNEYAYTDDLQLLPPFRYTSTPACIDSDCGCPGHSRGLCPSWLGSGRMMVAGQGVGVGGGAEHLCLRLKQIA